MDSFEDKVKTLYSRGNKVKFWNFDNRFSQDCSVQFEEFLQQLELSKGYGEKPTEENQKKIDVVRDIMKSEFSAGFVAGIKLFKHWIEQKALDNLTAYLSIEKDFEVKPNLEELQNKRNKLNREIATLKKDSLQKN